ncbi:hypothetical protein MIR68_004394 [Amoeboaphelidium protococcarum]|nr:hypothetical protein MIR68_004394 [Amoeboaphelidium protococcarum]KAI3654680.1 hypothetical protein MP228_000060 [Amoeboaphelidium protococcarum]
MNCESQACVIVLTYVFPALGVITGTLVNLSALPSILKIHRFMTRQFKSAVLLNDIDADKRPVMINPLPYAFQLPNALAWVFYSFVVKDYFIAAVNFLGCILPVYYLVMLQVYGSYLIVAQKRSANSLGMAKMQSISEDALNPRGSTQVMIEDDQQQSQATAVDVKLVSGQLAQSLLVTTVTFGINLILAIVVFIPLTPRENAEQYFAARKMIFGVASLIFLTFLYVAPLSVLYRILKLRYESKVRELIYIPLAIAMIMNGSLWSVYGFVLNDYFIWFPNVVAVVVGVLQVVLVFIFGKPPPVHEL